MGHDLNSYTPFVYKSANNTFIAGYNDAINVYKSISILLLKRISPTDVHKTALTFKFCTH